MNIELNGHWIESTKDNVSKVVIKITAMAIYEVYENNELSYSFSLDFDETLNKADMRMFSGSGSGFQGKYLFEWINKNGTEFQISALNKKQMFDVIALFIKQ